MHETDIGFPTISQVIADLETEGSSPMESTRSRFKVDVDRLPPVNEEQVHENMRDMTEEQALDRLEKLLDVPGMLQIITAECAVPDCPTRRIDPTSGRLVTEHDETTYSVLDHRHFVKHDVVSIDQDERGRIRANSAEGDWTVSAGGVRGLLRHLTRVSLGEG